MTNQRTECASVECSVTTGTFISRHGGRRVERFLEPEFRDILLWNSVFWTFQDSGAHSSWGPSAQDQAKQHFSKRGRGSQPPSPTWEAIDSCWLLGRRERVCFLSDSLHPWVRGHANGTFWVSEKAREKRERAQANTDRLVSGWGGEGVVLGGVTRRSGGCV